MFILAEMGLKVTSAELFLKKKLDERREGGNYRALKNTAGMIDFCSNDYLGFARSPVLQEMIATELKRSELNYTGSTGSRLLSGNSVYAVELEAEIADHHSAEAGLIFNSGYDANLGLFSSLPQRGDTIITDELIHASIIDGARLSYANRFIFKHNDLNSLEEKLRHAKGICYVAIESVYSMDGDTPPIEEIISLTEHYGAHLIVDEAHAVGMYGFGLVSGEALKKVFARVVTFGKALGCHGAVVLGSATLKNYLVNFARSFIYTTAPSYHELAAVRMAYGLLLRSGNEIQRLKQNIELFKSSLKAKTAGILLQSDSAIQSVVLGDNKKTANAAQALKHKNLDARPILSPTVPAGKERLRICLHAYNSAEEIYLLTSFLDDLINAQ